MKHVVSRTLCAILAMYLLLVSAGCKGPIGAEWKRYRYAADGFSAEFPAEPKASPNDDHSGTRYSTSMENDNFAYFVEKAALPANLNKTPEQVFEGYANGAAGGTNSKIKSQKSISMGSHPGREFVLENDKVVMQFRLYLVGKNLYQVLVVASTSKASRAQTDRFLNSFDLIE